MEIKRLTEVQYSEMACNMATKSSIVEAVLGKGTKEVFDYALPQPWLEKMADKCHETKPVLSLPLESTCMRFQDRGAYYDYIRSRCVWHYPPQSVFGQPLWLTDEAHEVMQKVMQALYS